MDGFAVIDLETTGFSFNRGDRIIELGMVLLDNQGRVEHTVETLVNPERAITNSHIHGITAADTLGAPRFVDIADPLAEVLQNRLFVAHNANFDRRFLADEMQAVNCLDDPEIPYLDTMLLARRYLNTPDAKLATCCSATGIVNTMAHSALADAMATAELLNHFINHFGIANHAEFHELLSINEAFTAYRPRPYKGVTLLSREESTKARAALDAGGWIDKAIEGRDCADELEVSRYFQLLDSVFLDRVLSQSEQSQLLSFAAEAGLSASALRELHRRYLDSLIKAAWTDNVMTDAERQTIAVLARYLGIEVSEYAPLLDRPPRSFGFLAPTVDSGESSQHSNETLSVSPVDTPTVGSSINSRTVTPSADSPALAPSSNLSGGLVLAPGDRVTVTGPLLRSREDWADFFASHGVECAGLSKKTRVLIAGDPDTMSGKAVKARTYSIPIIAEATVEDVVTFA